MGTKLTIPEWIGSTLTNASFLGYGDARARLFNFLFARPALLIGGAVTQVFSWHCHRVPRRLGVFLFLPRSSRESFFGGEDIRLRTTRALTTND